MILLKRTPSYVFALGLGGSVIFWNFLDIDMWAKIIGIVLLGIFFIYKNIFPLKNSQNLPSKIIALARGNELLLIFVICATLQTAAHIYLLLAMPDLLFWPAWVGSIVLNLLLLMIILINSLIRLFVASRQLSLIQRLLIIFLWWVPIANFAVFWVIYKTTRAEYFVESARFLRNKDRKNLRVCETKYPILMVHGIFFRDWEVFNYWGRIPRELENNGAKIFYGNQSSSSSIEDSAKEIKKRILEITAQEKCEKVNIIAHSKGGLDARYAISCLGMEKYVASLTTINTPHHGCRFARKALDNIPENMVGFVSKKYDKLFKKLGDNKVDFFRGVSELTDIECAKLNKKMVDQKNVYYQSIGSKMHSAKSAAFPLNLGYKIIQPIDGDNDGLVAVSSMKWEKFRLIKPVGKRGISHGDMIDLTRKDIKGFDVREFYVDIVRGLKKKGF